MKVKITKEVEVNKIKDLGKVVHGDTRTLLVLVNSDNEQLMLGDLHPIDFSISTIADLDIYNYDHEDHTVYIQVETFLDFINDHLVKKVEKED